MAIPVAIDPIAFHLGLMPIRWSALAYPATLIACAIALFRLQKREQLLPPGPWPFDLCVGVAVGVLIGARLGEVLLYRPAFFAAHPFEVFTLHQGGMASHGALLGAAIATVMFARRRGIDSWLLLDAVAVAPPFGFLLARIGNFIDGLPPGAVTDVPWAVIHPAIGLLPRHPVQLYQAAGEGVLLLLLLIAFPYPRYGFGSRAAWACIAYGAIRIVMENFKIVEPGPGIAATGIRNGQLYSVVLIAVGVVVAWKRWTRPAEPGC